MIAWFKKLPTYAKIALVLAIVYGLYQLFRWIKRTIEASNYQASVGQAQTAINQLAQQGVHPSYAQAQYTSYANTLKGAFEGCSGAMNSNSFWNTITPVFQSMKNDADIYALIKAYGVRTIDKCGLGTGDFEGDLAGTLSEKFTGTEGVLIGAGDGKDIKTINDILKSNGLQFTF